MYIQNISYTQTLSEIELDSGRLHDECTDEYISQWSKGDDTFYFLFRLKLNLVKYISVKFTKSNLIGTTFSVQKRHVFSYTG
jgi:hypothetical protein